MSERGGEATIEVGVMFHQLYTVATQRLNAALRPMGLTARHLSVMFLIRDGVQTQRDLVARLNIDKTGMVRTVDDLERLALVSRSPSTVDRRVTILELTDEGLRTLAAAQQQTRGVADELFAAVTPDELVIVKGILRRALEALMTP